MFVHNSSLFLLFFFLFLLFFFQCSAHQLKESRKRSAIAASLESPTSPVSNPLFVRSSVDQPDFDPTHNFEQDALVPAIVHTRRGSTGSRVSMESSDVPEGRKLSLYVTPPSSNLDLRSDHPEAPETPRVRHFGTVFDGPQGRDFVEPPSEGLPFLALLF